MAQTYDPKKIIVVCGGEVVTGYADGTHIEVTTNEDMHTLSVGNDGNGTFNINPNKSGTIKITLMHNSPSLNKIAMMGQAGVVLAITGMDNNSNGQKFFGNECVLQKQIDFARAKEVGTVEVTFLGEEVVVLPVG